MCSATIAATIRECLHGKTQIWLSGGTKKYNSLDIGRSTLENLAEQPAL